MRGKMVVYLCALSLFLGTGSAWCGPDSTARSGDSIHQKWWAQLNLSDDQKAKLKALRANAKDFRKTNFDRMKAVLDESKTELLKAAPSKAVLYGYAKEMGDIHKAMSEHMADQMLKMKSILTKEQFQKFLNREGMGGPGRGQHPPHDGGQGVDE